MAEMHSTTRRALHHNQALTSLLATLRARIYHLREENHKLLKGLQESNQKETIQKEMIKKLSTQNHRRAVLLEQIIERAKQQAKEHQQMSKLLKESDELRKDIRLQQAQLDATSDLTSQLKEKATERDIALELTVARLKEEDALNRSLKNTIQSTLHVLECATFNAPVATQTDADLDYSVSEENVLKQLVELLSSVELTSKDGKDYLTEVTKATEPLFKYSEGDIGLVPRQQRKHRK